MGKSYSIVGMSDKESLVETLGIIDTLVQQGILQVYVKNGKMYKGTEDQHRKGARAIKADAINEMFVEAWGKSAKSQPLYLDPQVIEDALMDAAAVDLETDKPNGTFFRTATDFVAYWLDVWGTEFTDSGLIYVDNALFTGTGKSARISVPRTTLAKRLKVKVTEYNNDSGSKLNRDDMAYVLDLVLFSRTKDKLIVVRKNLEYSSTYQNLMDEDELFRWARGLLNLFYVRHGAGRTVRDEDVLMFLHMLWQIKRKLFSLPVAQELIYSFYSLQQALGKTYLVQQLARPFKWGYAQTNVSEVLDPNARIAKCRDKFLVDMVELSKVSDTDGNHMAVSAMFKSLVGNSAEGTATHSLREFHTQAVMVEEQTTTFVTTTNIHVADVVGDTKDMRRFWEFYLDPDRGYDLDFYYAADPFYGAIEDVYRSIDENNEYGYYHPKHPKYSELYTACRRVQHEMTKTNAFDDWATMHGLEFADEPLPGYEKISLKSLTQKFYRYKTREGNESKAFNTFYVTTILINNHGLEPVKEMNGGMITKYVYMKDPAKPEAV